MIWARVHYARGHRGIELIIKEISLILSLLNDIWVDDRCCLLLLHRLHVTHLLTHMSLLVVWVHKMLLLRILLQLLLLQIKLHQILVSEREMTARVLLLLLLEIQQKRHLIHL